MRRIALALGIVGLMAGCDAEEPLPENPRNAGECRHHEDYRGVAMEGDAAADADLVGAKVTASIDGTPDSYEKDTGNYTFDFKMAVAGETAEALEVDVECDGAFSATLTDQSEPFGVVGSVEGVVANDGAEGTWALDNGMSGTWKLAPSE